MATVEALQAELLLNILPTENYAAVIFYVIGYCGKSLVKSTRCTECKMATVATIAEFVPPLTTTMHEYASKFFDGINQNGLCKQQPSYMKLVVFVGKFSRTLQQ